jgi:hypothetical protein
MGVRKCGSVGVWEWGGVGSVGVYENLHLYSHTPTLPYSHTPIPHTPIPPYSHTPSLKNVNESYQRRGGPA